MSATQFGPWRRSLFVGLIAIFAVSSTSQWVCAQGAKPKYFVVPIAADLQEGTPKYKDLVQTKSRTVAGSASFSDPTVRAKMDLWYQKYFFRSFTHPDQLEKLPLKRRELLADLARTGSRQSTQDVYAYLRQQAEFWGKGFVNSKQPFHPAVRFNAMLLLGDLNALEKSVAQKRRLPEPYAPMLGELVNALNQPKQIDAVKVAALIGLLRHAKLQWAGQNPHVSIKKRNFIAKMMLAIVNTQQPPAGRSDSGHIWMQRRAVEILAALRMIGEADVYNNAIASIVSNPESDLSLRCTAARSLALLNAKGRNPIDPEDTSLKLGALAVNCVQADLAWIDDFKLRKEIKKIADEAAAGGGGGGGGGMGGGMGGMGGMDGEMGAPEDEGGDDGASAMMGSMGGGGSKRAPLDPEVNLARRRLKYKLVCVRRGLSAVVEAAQGNAQVENVSDMVDAIMLATDPPEDDPTLDGLAKGLRVQIRALERLTRSAVPEAQEEAPVSAAPSAAPVSGIPAPSRTTATRGG